MSKLSERPEQAVVGETMPHESAALHVTGHALYTDDLAGRHPQVLHAHPVQAPHAHARVARLDPAQAYDVPGVPFVVVFDELGVVRSKGTVNTLEQVEGLVDTARRRILEDRELRAS